MAQRSIDINLTSERRLSFTLVLRRLVFALTGRSLSFTLAQRRIDFSDWRPL
jgi:hypothetical protein